MRYPLAALSFDLGSFAPQDVFILAPSGFSTLAAAYSLGVTIRFDGIMGAHDSVLLPRALALPVQMACSCRTTEWFRRNCATCRHDDPASKDLCDPFCPAPTDRQRWSEHGCLELCRAIRARPTPLPREALELPLKLAVSQLLRVKARATSRLKRTDRWMSFADAVVLGDRGEI